MRPPSMIRRADHNAQGILSTCMLRLVTAPTTNPLTPTEVKAHLRVDHTNDDTLVTALIAAASTHLDARDGILGRALMPQQWDNVIPAFPEGASTVPCRPPPTWSASRT